MFIMKSEIMKLATEQKVIKSEINEQLANVVKNLQQEMSLSTDGHNRITSDSQNAQQFISVLEAGFIHGLKVSYYEKKQSKGLPRPQFWNLVAKISHKDTLKQAKSLKMIKSTIGLCRAWLRLALNDEALTSYLSSLLTSAEHKTILTRYYDSFALFRDTEQADIFLRYLQGAENLEFGLASNSSVLNVWVRTPLEMAGIIAPTMTKPLLDNNNYVAGNVPRPSPWQLGRPLFDHRGSSSSGSSRHGSLRTPISVSPTASDSSESNNLASLPTNIALSLPPNIATSLPVQASRLSVAGSLVEVPPQAGTAPSCSPPQVEGARERGSVLHSRHIMKRRRKPRRNQSLDFGSSGTFGSSNSLSSNFSTQSSPQKKLDEGKASRSSSESSNNPTNSTSSDNSAQENSESFRHNTVPAWRRHSTPVLGDKYHHRNRRPVGNPLPEVSGTEPHEGAVHPPHDGAVHPPQEAAEDCPIASRLSPELPDNLPSPTQFVLDVGNPHRESPDNSADSSRMDSIDGMVDIYAQRSASPSFIEGEDVPRSYFNNPCTPVSPGNSLLCGVGWSSEQPYNEHSPHPNTTDLSSDPITQPPSKDKNKIVIHREGYLQKKGETLSFWRSRWFVLDGGFLTYFTDKNMRERLGRISLQQVIEVKEENLSKNKSISLLMSDGIQHQLAAESHNLIRDWLKDIHKVHEVIVSSAELTARESFGSDFEVLEGADVQDVLLGDDVSGSYHGSMMSHMTRIANEQGLDAQNYQCADCASPIGIIYGSPRVCSFTGQYYCLECHLNEESVVPARMLHNWDFRKHKVAKRSKRFLSQMWREPCIEMDKSNPAAYRHLAQMKQILPLRIKLAALQPYLVTCRRITHAQRNSKLQGHSYMLGNPHLYSAHDLQRSQSGDLYDVIEKIVTYGLEHVTSCSLCQAKGFLCEVCRKDEVIFAFNYDVTTQCEDCKSVYHKDCLPDATKCPKCLRRNERLKRQENDVTIDDK